MNTKCVTRFTTMIIFALNCLPLSALAEGIGLGDYLQQVQANHPFFTQQALNREIEQEQQRRYLGDEDWVLKARPSYQHEERSAGSALVAEEQDGLVLNAGMERSFWSNGSRISIDYDYSHLDQRFAAPVNSFDEHGNGVSITYTVPLLQNKGGELSRLDYEFQAYNVDLSAVNSAESQEQFLEQLGLLFLDWVFVNEQRYIAENRLSLANKELTRTKKKRRSRLVAEVDVLGARDAVINARQNLSAIESQWRALQAELATQSGNPGLYKMRPRYELYALKKMPGIEQALSDMAQNSRQLQAIDLQVAQLERLQSGLNNQLNPELDLVLGGGLKSESDHLSGSTRFDQPQYMIGVNFRYPLGQRSAKADVSKARLQQQQFKAARNSLNWQLEAQLRNLLVQLNELEIVMALNQEQIEVARMRTAGELNRHNQGRSELSFVIQSRDNEQNAQLAYAANAAKYHKLWLRYMALTDTLLPNSEQE